MTETEIFGMRIIVPTTGLDALLDGMCSSLASQVPLRNRFCPIRSSDCRGNALGFYAETGGMLLRTVWKKEPFNGGPYSHQTGSEGYVMVDVDLGQNLTRARWVYTLIAAVAAQLGQHPPLLAKEKGGTEWHVYIPRPVLLTQH